MTAITKLKNGATLLESREHTNGGNVVLAKTNGNMPYATWRADDDGNCYWGHYFNDLTEAVQDYNQR